MSTILGSLSPDTSCVAHLDWYRHGATKLDDADIENRRKINLLLTGHQNNEKKNSISDKLNNADQSHQKHNFLNYRQYVGKNS